MLSKRASNINFFSRGRHNNIDIYYISQSYFRLPKNTIRINSNINISCKQTLRDIILIFLDKAGLDISLEEWKQLCLKAWENDFAYFEIDRFAKKERVGLLLEIVIKSRIQNAPPKRNLFD